MTRPLAALPLRLLAAVVAMTVLVSGCNRKSPAGADGNRPHRITIGVTLLNSAAEFVAQVDRAMRTEAGKLGVDLVVTDAQLSADRQIQQIDGFVAQKVDAVILNPCQVDGSSPAVESALKAGIPIVNVNSETRSQPTAFVGSRDEDAGKMAMEFIAERLHGRGAVVIIEGAAGQAAQVKRNAGAREVLARHPLLKVIAMQNADWDRAKAITLMENWIQSYPNGIDAVFAENDEMAMGALIALEQAGLKSKVVVIGVDGISDALAAVKAKRLDATIFQDAKGQGSTAVQVAVAIVRHQPYEKETLIPFQLVTPETVERFLPR